MNKIVIITHLNLTLNASELFWLIKCQEINYAAISCIGQIITGTVLVTLWEKTMAVKQQTHFFLIKEDKKWWKLRGILQRITVFNILEK